MSIEGEYKENARVIHARLMGVQPKPPAKRQRPLEPPDIDVSLVILPKPTRAELAAIFEEDQEWRFGVKDILTRYGENLRRLTSLQRDTHIVSCRIDVANYLRARGWSYPRIGQFMHRDHSSIMGMISPDFKRRVERIKKNARAVADAAHTGIEIQSSDGRDN